MPEDSAPRFGAPGEPVNRRGRAHPARQASLREHNLAIVLSEIGHLPDPPSRADIAQATGLTRTTVSALVDQLIAGGLVSELPVVRSLRAGRPAAPLVLARRTMAAVGLEVNVDYLGIRVLDLAGEVVAEQVRVGDFRASRPDAALAELEDIYRSTMTMASQQGLPLAGICVALPGLVDAGAGPLRVAPNLHWENVNVVADLANRLALDPRLFTLVNEANVAAHAEANALGPSGSGSFFYVSGEIGVGGAIVTAGKIASGSHGWSGEIGHTLIDPNGPQCGCGATGCLEQYAGKDALMRGAGLDLRLPIEALETAARAAGPDAHQSLQTAGAALGLALANAVNLLDVDTVILGGIYAPLADFLLPGIREQLQLRVLWQPWAPVLVQPASCRDHAALTGAALTVKAAVLADPSRWINRQSDESQVG